jgi:hypothetical protein
MPGCGQSLAPRWGKVYKGPPKQAPPQAKGQGEEDQVFPEERPDEGEEEDRVGGLIEPSDAERKWEEEPTHHDHGKKLAVPGEGAGVDSRARLSRAQAVR